LLHRRNPRLAGDRYAAGPGRGVEPDRHRPV